jgi:hypothetical protein
MWNIRCAQDDIKPEVVETYYLSNLTWCKCDYMFLMDTVSIENILKLSQTSIIFSLNL